MKLSLQMYTVRKEARKDLKKVFCRLRALGITNVEMARTPLSEKTLEAVREARDSGMRVLSHQIRYDQLVQDSTLSYLKKEGCQTAVLSVIPMKCWGNSDEFYRFLEELGELETRYRKENITLAYHHHNYEAVAFGRQETGFDILLSELPAHHIKLVADTYWLQRCGYSPQKFIKTHSSLITGLHLRDFNVKKGLFFPRETDCMPPQGLLDMRKILKTANDAGVDYFALEADTRKPFRDIEIFMNEWNRGLKEAVK